MGAANGVVQVQKSVVFTTIHLFKRKEHVPVWQVEEMGMMSCEVQGSRLWRCEVRGAAGCAGAVNPVVAGKQ